MCGHDWCSVRISKEITDYYSGKDEEPPNLPKRPRPAPALLQPGADVLKKPVAC